MVKDNHKLFLLLINQAMNNSTTAIRITVFIHSPILTLPIGYVWS